MLTDEQTPEERFWSLVDKSGDCWLWLASKNSDGYGQFQVDRKKKRAHRFAYQLLVGEVPEGLVLDHLCRNRACVNPEHLEPVTNRENILRGTGLPAQAARQTHCVNGHLLDEQNTRIEKGIHRCCRACGREKQRRYKARKAASGK